MNALYRIVRIAEDGEYILKDGYTSLSKAEHVADKINEECGEGQRVFVESYTPTANW